MKCFFHPDREASVTCVNCQRKLCSQCFSVTNQGICCPLCNNDKQQNKLRPTERTMRRYGLGLAVTFLSTALLAPFILLPYLAFSVIIAYWQKLENWTRLAAGMIYFIGVWVLIIPALLKIEDTVSLQEDPPELPVSMFFLFICLLLLPFLWRPALLISRQLVSKGRGFAAGIVIAASLSAVAISLLIATAIILFTLS